MYRKQKVLLLREIACKKFMAVLSEKLESDFENESKDARNSKIEKVQEYLLENGATSNIYEALLAESRNHSIKSILAFKLFFSGATKTFYFYEYLTMENGAKRYLKVIARSCAQLEKLNLACVNMCSTCMRYIMQILARSPNLKHIELPGNYVSNEIWLQILSDNCPKLRFLSLDVSSKNLIAEFLSNKSFTSSLAYIGFGLREIGIDDLNAEISGILKICPNLLWFVKSPNIGPALSLCQKENKYFKCNIQHLFERHPTRHILEAIVSTCTKLKSLEIVAPQLNTLQVLGSTSLSHFDIRHFACQDLLELLKIIGHGLTSLSVASHKGALDVGEVLKLCPSIRELRFGNAVMGHYEWPVDAPTCAKLEKLHLFHDHIGPESTVIFVNFFSCLENLKFFYAEYVLFTDFDMLKIFGCHHFNNLQSFFVKKAPQMTIQSVYTLLDCCPNLQLVGKLTGWSIQKNEMETVLSLKLIDSYKDAVDIVHF